MNNIRVSCLVVLALSACHQTAPSEPLTSSIAPSTPLDSLSDTDLDELCEWLSEEGGSYVPSRLELCRFNGLSRATNPIDCEAEVTACFEGSSTVQVSCKLDPDAFVGCDASVEAFQACARDRAQSDERYFAGLACDDPRSGDPLPLPRSCESLRSACPDLIAPSERGAGGGSGGGGSGTGSNEPYVDGGRVCKDGRDIDDAWWCDGTVDCFAGEDEGDCERPRMFRCNDGFSIEAELACNQTNDCADRSDELNCDDGYRCTDGVDIWDTRVCDGSLDCARGEDEASCPSAIDPDPTP